MMMRRVMPKRYMHLVAAFAVTLAASITADAQSSASQNWPAKQITLIVPFPPGPALDLVARLVGAKLTDALGPLVVVENRTGANGTLGANAVARAAPDGATLLITTASTHVTAVHLMKNLPYDPVKDFSPIAAAVEPVTCLVVNGALPVNSVTELVAYAKARPGELSYGSSGVGSVFHLMGELFNQSAGVKINHVPYRGVAPALQDVVAGHIPMVFLSISNALAVADAKSVNFSRCSSPHASRAVPIFPPCRRCCRHFGNRPHGSVCSARLVCRLPWWRVSIPRSSRRSTRPTWRPSSPTTAWPSSAARRRLQGADRRRHRALRRDHQGGRRAAGVASSFGLRRG